MPIPLSNRDIVGGVSIHLSSITKRKSGGSVSVKKHFGLTNIFAIIKAYLIDL